MKNLKDFDLKNKRVLVRCDLNTPLDERGNILNDFRIKEVVPTIFYLRDQDAKIILMSHLGDPEGKNVEILNLNKTKEKLEELLNLPIKKANDCIGSEVEDLVSKMNFGDILLLENLRFHKEEEENDPEFAKNLAKLGDIYVNDAFSVCHRKHASISAITEYLPSCAGLLLENEIITLNKIIDNPDKPLVAILGGAKVETKVQLIDKISKVADFVLVGGLLTKEIREKNIVFENSEKIIKASEGLDINKNDIEIFKEKILTAKTIFWNGPLGKTENEEFSVGTKEIANVIIESNAFSVVGGGETIEFINRMGLNEKFSHISTGGGAMLSFLSGEKLPGIETL